MSFVELKLTSGLQLYTLKLAAVENVWEQMWCYINVSLM